MQIEYCQVIDVATVYGDMNKAPVTQIIHRHSSGQTIEDAIFALDMLVRLGIYGWELCGQSATIIQLRDGTVATTVYTLKRTLKL